MPSAAASIPTDVPVLPPFEVEIEYNTTKMVIQLMLGSSVYSHDTDISTQHSYHNSTSLVRTQQTSKMYHYFYHEEIPLWFALRKYVLLTRRNG